jgi:hypothetical protein
MKYVILTISYTSFAVPYTEAVAKALPDLLSISKVSHKTGDVYTKDAVRPDISIILGEVENGNN